jgi:hypothetical protein
MYQRVFELDDCDGLSGFRDFKRVVADAADRMTPIEVLELADMLHDKIRERRRRQFECDPTQPGEPLPR